MSDDDEAARNAKAASLREHINRLKSSVTGLAKEDGTAREPQPSEDDPSAKESGTGTKENPRDFIQRRMRELDKEKR